MSNAQDRLSRLRRDLWKWHDALNEVARKADDPVAIKPSDVAAGVKRILDEDQARIGKPRDQWGQ
jgi:hypothetical protein